MPFEAVRRNLAAQVGWPSDRKKGAKQRSGRKKIIGRGNETFRYDIEAFGLKWTERSCDRCPESTRRFSSSLEARVNRDSRLPRSNEQLNKTRIYVSSPAQGLPLFTAISFLRRTAFCSGGSLHRSGTVSARFVVECPSFSHFVSERKGILLEI